MALPETTTLLLAEDGPVLHITLNRPDTRNAMSLTMVDELMNVLTVIEHRRDIRAVVIRGAGGHFCAGGDVRDMSAARETGSDDVDGFYRLNRAFGLMLQQAERQPQVIVTVLEGAVLGGGFGLACISDVALAHQDSQFGLPETSLGLIPAQIAPFVVKRIGLTQARRLALLGLRIKGPEALTLGLVHTLAEDSAALDAQLAETLSQVRKCAPDANRVTKQLLLDVDRVPLDELLDAAARNFARAVRSPEGMEGTMAFLQKRPATWAE